MRLTKARIKGYRSIKDTGYFEIEDLKTILVGINESGKTAILQSLQKINPPTGTSLLEPLRDYPRSDYDEDVVHGKIDPASFTVVEGHFSLNDDEKEKMPEGFENITYVYGRYLDNQSWQKIDGGIPLLKFSNIEKDLQRMCIHFDKTYSCEVAATSTVAAQPTTAVATPSETLKNVIKAFVSTTTLSIAESTAILAWINANLKYLDEQNETENDRYDGIKHSLSIASVRSQVLTLCKSFLPTFVLFNNYFKIRPTLHLERLATRTENNMLDDAQYDYGNNCLLKYLGFTARELSTLGNTSSINIDTADGMKKLKDQLDDRNYRLNAASIRLTKAIVDVWNPSGDKRDANKLKIVADGQYLKVVVEDELGVEVELDQRSEGFQWLVSFFIVFFAEAEDKHKNAVLLLDEPGMSLHALKQVEFRQTITSLSKKNQTIFTTHSPFLIGSNELDLVRVIEMNDRNEGTKVSTSITATDNGALLPLQEALGYDLAQSLFFHKKNLVLEGLTDYWYLEAFSELAKEDGKVGIDDKISLNPANCASKLVYYATILHAQNLNVSALLDSDAEGDLAATQDTLVNALGNKRIIRTKDVYSGEVKAPEIEDLIRGTLVKIAKDELSWDVIAIANKQSSRPIVNIFNDSMKSEFSKFKLSKGFLRWARKNKFADLTALEQESILMLIERINKSLK